MDRRRSDRRAAPEPALRLVERLDYRRPKCSRDDRLVKFAMNAAVEIMSSASNSVIQPSVLYQEQVTGDIASVVGSEQIYHAGGPNDFWIQRSSLYGVLWPGWEAR